MSIHSSQPDTPSEHDLELLSSYLDQQLAADEQVALEERLRRSPELQRELDELQATVAFLQEAAPVIPPRSFTLDPAQVQQRRPVFTGWMRFGSALAALVLALTVTTVLVFNQRQDTATDSAVGQFESYAATEDEATEQGAGAEIAEGETMAQDTGDAIAEGEPLAEEAGATAAGASLPEQAQAAAEAEPTEAMEEAASEALPAEGVPNTMPTLPIFAEDAENAAEDTAADEPPNDARLSVAEPTSPVAASDALSPTTRELPPPTAPLPAQRWGSGVVLGLLSGVALVLLLIGGFLFWRRQRR